MPVVYKRSMCAVHNGVQLKQGWYWQHGKHYRWHSLMANFNGTVVYIMVEKGGRVPPAACLVLPSLSLLLAAKLLFIIFWNICSKVDITNTHRAVRGDVCGFALADWSTRAENLGRNFLSNFGNYARAAQQPGCSRWMWRICRKWCRPPPIQMCHPMTKQVELRDTFYLSGVKSFAESCISSVLKSGDLLPISKLKSDNLRVCPSSLPTFLARQAQYRI